MADARWRDPQVIGFAADLMPLLERDCPKDTPPFDPKTFLGKEAFSENLPLGWWCLGEVRPGLWRYLLGGFSNDLTRVRIIEFGYMWRAKGATPPECTDLRERWFYEYLTKVVKNDDGVGLTGDEVVRIRNRSEPDVMTSTGPLSFGGVFDRTGTVWWKCLSKIESWGAVPEGSRLWRDPRVP